MDVLLRAGDEDLHALRRWLSSEPELHGRVTLLRGVPQPGQMGTLTDGLAIALGSGGALSVLFSSLAAWLGRARTPTTVEIDGGGRTIRVSSGDPKEVRALLERVRAQWAEPPVVEPD